MGKKVDRCVACRIAFGVVCAKCTYTHAHKSPNPHYCTECWEKGYKFDGPGGRKRKY